MAVLDIDQRHMLYFKTEVKIAPVMDAQTRTTTPSLRLPDEDRFTTRVPHTVIMVKNGDL